MRPEMPAGDSLIKSVSHEHMIKAVSHQHTYYVTSSYVSEMSAGDSLIKSVC
jgi:hypothetical protein